MRKYSVHSQRTPADIRSDASENRHALILAARKLWVELGPEISMADIAKAAGVSRVTIYRNFPDKKALITAVFHYNLDLLEAYGRRIDGQSNRFRQLLKVIADQQASFHKLIPFLAEGDPSLVTRVLDIFAEPVQEAKQSGALRADFQIGHDLMLVIMMIGGALLHQDEQSWQQKASRALDLVMEGLKAESA